MRRVSRAIVSLLLVISLAMSLFPIAAHAATHTQAVEWVKNQLGKFYDIDGINGVQCSDFASAYVNWLTCGDPYALWNFTTYNGYQYFTAPYPSGWERIPNSSSLVPQPGDIMCFAAGNLNQYGHVAIAIEGCTTTRYNAIQQSGSAQSSGVYQVNNRAYFDNYNSFQGVIRPKFDNPEPHVRADNIGTDFYATLSLEAYPDSYVTVDTSLQAGNSDNHVFHFVRNSNGTYAIRSKANGNLLDVANFGSIEGTIVGFVPGDAPNTAQQWRIQKNNSTYILAPECAPHLVLDLNPVVKKIWLWTPNGSGAGIAVGNLQRFEINRLEVYADDIGTDFDATLSLEVYPRYYVSLNGDFLARNDNKHIFTFTRNTNGTYAIRSKENGMLLDTANWGSVEGTTVGFVEGSVPNTAQQWRIQKTGSSYILAPECSPHLVLDLNPVDKKLWLWRANGNGVGISGGNCQRFQINKLETHDNDISIEKPSTTPPVDKELPDNGYVKAIDEESPYTDDDNTTSLPPLNVPWENHYMDVSDNDWFYNAIRYTDVNGLMTGTDENKFSPNITMTRAMLVTVLYNLENRPAVSGTLPFEDVKNGEWYSKPILWAYQNNIVAGYTNGDFGWNNAITREQAVVVLYNYAQMKGLDVSASINLSGYTDVRDISEWALAAMIWARAEELMTGRTTTTLVPKGTATRAEMATLIMKLIQNQ